MSAAHPPRFVLHAIDLLGATRRAQKAAMAAARLQQQQQSDANGQSSERPIDVDDQEEEDESSNELSHLSIGWGRRASFGLSSLCLDSDVRDRKGVLMARPATLAQLVVMARDEFEWSEEEEEGEGDGGEGAEGARGAEIRVLVQEGVTGRRSAPTEMRSWGGIVADEQAYALLRDGDVLEVVRMPRRDPAATAAAATAPSTTAAAEAAAAKRNAKRKRGGGGADGQATGLASPVAARPAAPATPVSVAPAAAAAAAAAASVSPVMVSPAPSTAAARKLVGDLSPMPALENAAGVRYTEPAHVDPQPKFDASIPFAAFTPVQLQQPQAHSMAPGTLVPTADMSWMRAQQQQQQAAVSHAAHMQQMVAMQELLRIQEQARIQAAAQEHARLQSLSYGSMLHAASAMHPTTPVSSHAHAGQAQTHAPVTPPTAHTPVPIPSGRCITPTNARLSTVARPAKALQTRLSPALGPISAPTATSPRTPGLNATATSPRAAAGTASVAAASTPSPSAAPRASAVTPASAASTGAAAPPLSIPPAAISAPVAPAPATPVAASAGATATGAAVPSTPTSTAATRATPAATPAPSAAGAAQSASTPPSQLDPSSLLLHFHPLEESADPSGSVIGVKVRKLSRPLSKAFAAYEGYVKQSPLRFFAHSRPNLTGEQLKDPSCYDVPLKPDDTPLNLRWTIEQHIMAKPVG